MERLAECYLDAPRNLSLPTTPGRQIWFNGGRATIFFEQDLPTVLRRDDVTVYPSERYRDWWRDWLDRCGEHQPARAKIEVEGVVHEPPYAMLRAQSPGAYAPLASEPSTDTGEIQGAVLAAKRGPGRPRKVWASPEGTGVEDRAPVDPDGLEASGGSHPLDADIDWDNDDPRR